MFTRIQQQEIKALIENANTHDEALMKLKSYIRESDIVSGIANDYLAWNLFKQYSKHFKRYDDVRP